MRTRFDPLLRLRERTEEEAKLAVASELRGAEAVRARIAAFLEAEARPPGDAAAAFWELHGAERLRHRATLERLEVELAAAEARVEGARATLAAAHRAAESLRRAVESRHAAALMEAARRERKAQDELAALRFSFLRR
ncbi:hypothetical protein [Vulgatibacter sp.]|uniref:hypothetical protein n=1 Tax=Vulgatibacter sp. TaxID=1971226 RepID=UPI0035675E8D